MSARLTSLGGLLAALLALAAISRAAPLQRDLGEGLNYVRPTQLPIDLAGLSTPASESVILDLRNAEQPEGAAEDLGRWLQARPGGAAPVFVLVNQRTRAELLSLLDHKRRSPGLLTVGRKTDAYMPDIVVSQSEEDEQRAWEGLAAGAAITLLTTDIPGKQRNDEASLSRERAHGPLRTDSDPGSAASTEKKAPPIDAALQRALHLHRALQTMKSIPAKSAPASAPASSKR